MQFISVIFTILAVIAAIMLVIGVIKPTAFDQEGKEPKRITKSVRLDNIIVIGFFLIIFGGLAIAAHPSGSKQPASKTVATTQAATKTPPTKSAATTPAPTSQPTTAQQVHSWDVQYGYLVTSLQDDFTQAQKDLQAQDTTAFAADCSNISGDATTAQSKPAIPDTTIQANWATALSDYATGGTACTNGINSNDSTQLSQGATDFNNGSTALTKATQEIDELN